MGLSVTEDERHSPVERVNDGPTVADYGVVDLPADRMLDVGHPDPKRRVGSVQDQPDLVLVAERFGHLEEEPDVLDAGHLESQHDQDDVGQIEDSQRSVVEPRRAIDHHQLVALAQGLDHAFHARRCDGVGHLRRGWGQDDADARRVGHRVRVHGVGIAARLEVRHEFEHRLVLGVEVQQNGHVAELERAVHEHDLLVQLGGGYNGQIDGDGRASDTTLGAEDGHDGA